MINIIQDLTNICSYYYIYYSISIYSLHSTCSTHTTYAVYSSRSIYVLVGLIAVHERLCIYSVLMSFEEVIAANMICLYLCYYIALTVHTGGQVTKYMPALVVYPGLIVF